MPTITIDKDTFDIWGKTTVVQATFLFDASYPSGGETLNASDFMMKVIKGVEIVGKNAAAGRMMFSYDTANKKLMCFYPTGGATAAPGALADPISTTGAATASAVDATQPNITPGRGKEVLATTDLSSLSVELLVRGLG